MKAPRTLVALSPHLDDIALSAVATMCNWPGRRILATVFSADPPNPHSAGAAAFHAACGLGDDPMGQRRAEDRASCAILDCEPIHLELQEVLYRTTATGEPVVTSVSDVFDGDPVREPNMVMAVARSVRELLDGLATAVLLVPMGNGRHRDHAIVRAAVESLDAPVLGYYEEQPYGWRDRPPGPPAPATYRRQVCPLEPTAWQAKVEALACHESQVGLLWGSRWQDALAAEHAHLDGMPAEVLWRAPQ